MQQRHTRTRIPSGPRGLWLRRLQKQKPPRSGLARSKAVALPGQQFVTGMRVHVLWDMILIHWTGSHVDRVVRCMPQACARTRGIPAARSPTSPASKAWPPPDSPARSAPPTTGTNKHTHTPRMLLSNSTCRCRLLCSAYTRINQCTFHRMLLAATMRAHRCQRVKIKCDDAASRGAPSAFSVLSVYFLADDCHDEPARRRTPRTFRALAHRELVQNKRTLQFRFLPFRSKSESHR